MLVVLDVVNVLALSYFAVLNLTYLGLTLASFPRTHRYIARLKSLHVNELLSAAGSLPISLLVPAFDEEATIVEATRSLLTLRYPEYEIIVVSDGSTDATIEVLAEAFDLRPAHRLPTSAIPTAGVRRVLRSRVHPHLWLIDKENGGKADALNAGLNHSRYPLFAALDADTLLEPDALIRIARPFLEDQRTVAAGAMIRIANGCRIRGGEVEEVALPHRLIPEIQIVEYLRAFFVGRTGWDAVGGTLIVSGAFGVFRRSIVAAAGGFSTDTVGEDMELIVRLHRYCRENNIPYRISFVPDPVAWTEAPETLRSLGRQRSRWQRGLAQALTRHLPMMGRRRYGTPGVLAFPYHFFLELFGPVIEALGYLSFGLSLALGVASPRFVIAFLFLSVFLGSALSVAAVALEEMSFRRYRKGRDLAVMLGLALVETLGYRHLNTYWRLKGMWAFLRGDNDWGTMDRRGFGEDDSAATSTAPAAGGASR
ncbi:poly-beta-1,6-N-acetyl-D-glucosamine synthase [bacterium BMS3Bbin02]|nr:poly-beta-1,6-N-acetyl-D-glucosamine synthase [bacterium BMS3Bbin02]HDH24620.1 glycosyltransferase family 2 protein [Actinomycetota bacterium]